MKKIICSSACILLLVVSFSCVCVNSQHRSDARIENIDFDLKGSQLIITYDIENYARNEVFYITAEIFYESGERISAKSLSGDIKGNVRGGKNKTIIWDLGKDRIELKGAIYIEITASPELVAEKTREDKTEKSIGLTVPLIQSIVLPGLGNARITRKPYWIVGIIGYGSLASSYWFNQRAASSYDNYLSERDNPDLRIDYYNDADTEKQISVACGIAAGVIWAADLTLLIINHNKHKKRFSSMSVPQTTFGINYNPNLHSNMLTIRISF
jgi:hypothetical protein